MSNVQQLRDGRVFLEILKHFLIKQGMDENELNVDDRLTPFERIKLVLCSLMELIEDEDRARVKEFDKNCLNCYNNDTFLLQFGFFLKELYEKETNKGSLCYLNTHSKETDSENERDRYEEKDSFFNPKKNIKNDLPRPRRVTQKTKQNSAINIITDYIEDSHHQPTNNSNDLYYEENNEDVSYDDQRSKFDEMQAKKMFSEISYKKPNIKSNQFDEVISPIYSKQSLLTYNYKTTTKYTRQQKADINLSMGIEIRSKISKNNLHNNTVTQPLFQYSTFLYPTKPIIDISLSSIKKNETIIQKQSMATISNDSMSNSLLNIIGTEGKKPVIPYTHRDNYSTVVKWLTNLCVIKNSNMIKTKAKSGVLFCDIINRCESKNETIKGIIRSPFTQKQALLNINKALTYLRKINIRSQSLWNAEQIQKGNDQIIFELLNDLYLYYSKSLGKVRSYSNCIKPNHINKINDETGTLLLNDSLFFDKIPNFHQPMTQMSSLSNIYKTPKNQDISHHTTVTNSNICTIANCLGVNTTSIKRREEKNLIRNKISATQQHSRDKKSFSYKSGNLTNRSTKTPECFIILKKANIHQIQNQITKLCLVPQYNNKKVLNM